MCIYYYLSWKNFEERTQCVFIVTLFSGCYDVESEVEICHKSHCLLCHMSITGVFTGKSHCFVLHILLISLIIKGQ